MSNPGNPIGRGAIVAGKYKLLRPLGEGAMGVVWAAMNLSTAREVALKLILKPEPEFRLRLQREAKACGALKHRNIIDVYDVGQTDEGDPFLVMQLLTGETVDALLQRKRRLDPWEASTIGREVAKALSAAHHLSIVHRDLKPANIFLHTEPDADGPVVKVLDFGVAKNLAVNDGLHTMVGGAVGSPLYMSPEQVRAQRDVDHRADIWALGVVMFEMLAGVRPFQGDANAVFGRILGGELPLVSRYVRRLDPGLDAIVARCMARDREQRFQDAADVAAVLEPYTVPGAGIGPRTSASSSDSGVMVVAPPSSSGLEASSLGRRGAGPSLPRPRAAELGTGASRIGPAAADASGPFAAMPSGSYPVVDLDEDDDAATIRVTPGMAIAAMRQMVDQRQRDEGAGQPPRPAAMPPGGAVPGQGAPLGAMPPPAQPQEEQLRYSQAGGPPAGPATQGAPVQPSASGPWPAMSEAQAHGTVRMASSPELPPHSGSYGAVPGAGFGSGLGAVQPLPPAPPPAAPTWNPALGAPAPFGAAPLPHAGVSATGPLGDMPAAPTWSPGMGAAMPAQYGSGASSTTPLVVRSGRGPTVGGGTLPIGTYDLTGEASRRRTRKALFVVGAALGLCVVGAILAFVLRTKGDAHQASPVASPDTAAPTATAPETAAPEPSPPIEAPAASADEPPAGVTADAGAPADAGAAPQGTGSVPSPGLINREFPEDPPPAPAATPPVTRGPMPGAQPRAPAKPADPCADLTGFLLTNCRRAHPN